MDTEAAVTIAQHKNAVLLRLTQVVHELLHQKNVNQALLRCMSAKCGSARRDDKERYCRCSQGRIGGLQRNAEGSRLDRRRHQREERSDERH